MQQTASVTGFMMEATNGALQLAGLFFEVLFNVHAEV